jgi:hypothetical protein
MGPIYWQLITATLYKSIRSIFEISNFQPTKRSEKNWYGIQSPPKDVSNEAFQVYIDILEMKTRSTNVAENTWRRGLSKHGTHIPPFLNIRGGIYTKPIADSGNSSQFLIPKMLKGDSF